MSCKLNFSLTDKWIVMKIYTVAGFKFNFEKHSQNEKSTRNFIICFIHL